MRHSTCLEQCYKASILTTGVMTVTDDEATPSLIADASTADETAANLTSTVTECSPYGNC